MNRLAKAIILVMAAIAAFNVQAQVIPEPEPTRPEGQPGDFSGLSLDGRFSPYVAAFSPKYLSLFSDSG